MPGPRGRRPSGFRAAAGVPALRRPVRLAVAVSLLTAIASALAGIAWTQPVPLSFLAWSLAGGVLTAVLAGCSARLLLPAGGASPEGGVRLGPANALTLVRFALIAPTASLLAAERHAPAAIFYGVLLATDVADGVVARARGETSRFGVVMDPLADVASTYAVYTLFWLDELVPGWLYLLLSARYAMLLFGSLLLARFAGPVAYRATIPGKIVGVVQAAGALWIMAAAAGVAVVPRPGGVLFAILGSGFVAIVISQARIGALHVRRAAHPGGWQGGSSR